MRRAHLVGWVGLVTWAWLPTVGRVAAEPQPDFTTVVRSLGSGARARPAESVLSVEDARQLAGGLGDPLRAIESLPGVGRPALGSGSLLLWGAAPGDSRVIYLGMELPSLYHASGLRGALPAALLSSVRLVPAGFGAEYGRALGGLVLLAPRALPDGWHGELAADLLDVSAMVSGAAGPRLRLLAAGRYSYLDRLLSALSRPDLGDYFPLPQYWDAQAQAQLALPAGARLRATILASGDTTVRAHALSEPGRVQRETQGTTSYRLGLHYERPANGDGAGASEGAGGLQLAPWLGLDRRRYDAHFFGQDTARLSDDWLYGLRASHRQTLYSGRAGLSIALTLGGDLLGRYAQVSRTGTLSRPARDETGVVFGQPPGFLVNSDAWSVHLLDMALYAALGLRLGRLSVEVGLRGGGVLSDVSRLLPRVGDSPPLGGRQIEAQLAPRLQAALQAHRTLRLSLAGGLYQQPPSPSDLSAVFGRPRLGSSRALHLTAASSFSPHPHLQIELAGYLRLLDRLAAQSPLPTPPLAGALTEGGSGRAYGGQIRIQLSEATLGRGRWATQLAGWLGYSLSRSERREAPTSPTLPSLYDQTHSLQATGRLGLRRLSMALRLQYTTGQPRPAVLGSYYNAWTDQDEPLLGPLGSARLPDFLQLDLRLEYTFLLPAGLRLCTQLEIQNLTHHPNVQELAYSPDWGSSAPITGLPTLAVLGLRVSR